MKHLVLFSAVLFSACGDVPSVDLVPGDVPVSENATATVTDFSPTRTVPIVPPGKHVEIKATVLAETDNAPVSVWITYGGAFLTADARSVADAAIWHFDVFVSRDGRFRALRTVDTADTEVALLAGDTTIDLTESGVVQVSAWAPDGSVLTLIELVAAIVPDEP